MDFTKQPLSAIIKSKSSDSVILKNESVALSDKTCFPLHTVLSFCISNTVNVLDCQRYRHHYRKTGNKELMIIN